MERPADPYRSNARPGRIRGTDIVEWDESHPSQLIDFSWPGYERVRVPLLKKLLSFGDVAGILGGLGYHIVSVSTSRHGFLWLKKARYVTFLRFVELSGDPFCLKRETEALCPALLPLLVGHRCGADFWADLFAKPTTSGNTMATAATAAKILVGDTTE